ncbi:MAG TPA: glycogen debranching protein GlgX, partial [Actinomycetota bacterium]|nr:glycogen debranching protein GlgX [Actinomycetota bacterium]
VDLCIFERPDDAKELHRIPMRERTDLIWHCYLPEARPGLLYGYRLNDPDTDLSFDERDDAAFVPKCVVADDAFTWGADRAPHTPWNRTVIYEAHVKGMTMRHPHVPDELRGTYLGLASDPIIDHLKDLGVTAIELLPVHQSIPEPALLERGLTNYWGYNSIGFFAPEARYATGSCGQQVDEFKTMVKRFHHAGIEVILDVVYNHTAEGNHLGPTLCFRGIDNAAYYRLVPDDERYYMDFTGCGNSLNMVHPRTLQLIMDSLRYWVTEMHVDGFRFDLASTLARELFEVNRLSTFFEIIQQDPVLSHVKLIAEPWDVGEGGYQVGNFPIGWAEWNDKYRDCVRRFWRGDPGQVRELAYRLSGSSDLYEASGRRTYASINFVTAHDGFTLNDLVSYERKHNEANGEDNRDGNNDNLSRNWGAEGPTDSARVNSMRARMKRNFLATLFFSQGVPMIVAGDEMGRTQHGNNNAYCQDNEISWIDWDIDPNERSLMTFAQTVLRIFREQPVFRRRSFFSGKPMPSGMRDVMWIRPDGAEMTDDDWFDTRNHILGMLTPGDATGESDERGRPIYGDTLLFLLNGSPRSRYFAMPDMGRPGVWHEMLNTARAGQRVVSKGGVNLVAHSVILLRFEPLA